MSCVIVNQGAQTDIDSVLEMARELFHLNVSGFNFDSDWKEQSLYKSLIDKNVIFLVASTNEVKSGYLVASIKTFESRELVRITIDEIYVKNNFRRNKNATALYDKLISISKELSTNIQVDANINLGNLEGEKFFLNRGLNPFSKKLRVNIDALS